MVVGMGKTLLATANFTVYNRWQMIELLACCFSERYLEPLAKFVERHYLSCGDRQL
jgi:hypothetical protein